MRWSRLKTPSTEDTCLAGWRLLPPPDAALDRAVSAVRGADQDRDLGFVEMLHHPTPRYRPQPFVEIDKGIVE